MKFIRTAMPLNELDVANKAGRFIIIPHIYIGPKPGQDLFGVEKDTDSLETLFRRNLGWEGVVIGAKVSKCSS